MDNSNWNKKQDSDNYQRLLDNLIDIKRNDSCLFAKVDNSDFIDLVEIFYPNKIEEKYLFNQLLQFIYPMTLFRKRRKKLKKLFQQMKFMN